MSISAKILLDSVSPVGARLTTYELTLPRMILSELNTHRMISKNAASSRAIPFKKMLERIQKDPFIPIRFGKNIPGMKDNEEVSADAQVDARQIWLRARDAAIEQAQKLDRLGIHKQVVNRLLEPWMWATVICTATDWDNFFYLRCHKDAEPHFQELAKQMYLARTESRPQVLQYGKWHTPLIKPEEALDTDTAIRSSVARCARVSYLNHDGTDPNTAKDFKLYDQLLNSGHLSPFEHIAQCTETQGMSGNFSGGWLQYRKLIPNENQTNYPGIIGL